MTRVDPAGANVPAAHGNAVVAVDAHEWPAGHCTHDADPVLDAYLPAAHAEHVALESAPICALYLPSPHARHAALPI